MANQWLDFCKSYIPRVNARHLEMLHRPCELENPRRFTDKLEWLKIYDSTFLKSYCADKYTVRRYVKAKIGKDICIPLLGVYNSFDEINFSALPTNYVLKTNHGSHTNIIVRDGVINKQQSAKQFKEWLSKDWSWYGYELHYIPIPRKIILEEFKTDGNISLTDYKFLCFNGKPTLCQVIAERHSKNQHLNYYDMNWEQQKDISRIDFPANYDITHNTPKTLDLMIKYATRLSADFKFVRVDFYEIDGEVFFGELTFIPAAAYIQYSNEHADFILGSYLKL